MSCLLECPLRAKHACWFMARLCGSSSSSWRRAFACGRCIPSGELLAQHGRHHAAGLDVLQRRKKVVIFDVTTQEGGREGGREGLVKCVRSSSSGWRCNLP